MRAACVAAACALLLAACASTPPPERIYSGRFAATAERGAERQSVSGRFTVAVQGPRQVLELATPVGTTVARVQIEPGRATATGPGQLSISGTDADALIEQTLGWRLPVAGLADWLAGRPDPARPSTWLAPDRRFEQDGWTVSIEERAAAGTPRRLLLERPQRAAEPAVTVRLIVDDPSA